MPTQRFTLIVEGPDLQSEPLIDELFDAGCDDATFGRSDGVQYVDFDREAADLGEAIFSAVRDLEQFKGVHVKRIVNVDPAPVTETVARTQRSRESVGLLVTSAPRPVGFRPPAPCSRSAHVPWRSFDFALRSRPDSKSRQRSLAVRTISLTTQIEEQDPTSFFSQSTSSRHSIATVPSALRPTPSRSFSLRARGGPL